MRGTKLTLIIVFGIIATLIVAILLDIRIQNKVISSFLPSMVNQAVARAIDADYGMRTHRWLFDDSLHIVLCGTGTPIPDPDRASACVAVIGGGSMYIFDTGPGSWENVRLWGLPAEALNGVFLTHFHSDHIGELGEFIVQSWISGREKSLPVYGPPGVEKVVNGFQMAYELDSIYRMDHHGTDNLPSEGAKAHAKVINIPENSGHLVPALEVEDKKGRKMSISAFEVNHYPVKPAYGYLIEYCERSVVISGDTIKTPNTVQYSKGVDILIHEALAHHIIKPLSEGFAQKEEKDKLRKRIAKRLGKLTADVLDYHASPLDALQVAQEAGAQLLVLTHQVPGQRNVVLKKAFMMPISERKNEKPEVIMGDDGMHFALPAGIKDIQSDVIGEVLVPGSVTDTNFGKKQ